MIGHLSFDIGYTKSDELKVKASDWNLDVYVITGTDVKDIVRQFRCLIGRSYIPPLWAFGYGQSRWGYESEDDVREVVKDTGISTFRWTVSTWTSITWSAIRISR